MPTGDVHFMFASIVFRCIASRAKARSIPINTIQGASLKPAAGKGPSTNRHGILWSTLYGDKQCAIIHQALQHVCPGQDPGMGPVQFSTGPALYVFSTAHTGRSP